jgi:hypothetical protein
VQKKYGKNYSVIIGQVMSTIINKSRRNAKKYSDEKLKESGKRFFTEPVHMYGMKTALVGTIAKNIFKEIHDI